MVSIRKTKPMGINRLNLLLKEQGYKLEKLENGEVVMVKLEGEK